VSAALTRKAAAAVSMGTYSAWESTATLRLLRGAPSLPPRGSPRGRRGAGHIVSPCAQLVSSNLIRIRDNGEISEEKIQNVYTVVLKLDS